VSLRSCVVTIFADGTAISKDIRAEIKAEVEKLQNENQTTPGLAVVLVGARPDSATYVRMKKKAAAEVRFHSVDIELPETVSEADLLIEVEKLNADPKVHGILVQLPLPKHINEALVLKTIKVEKDADGFSAFNIGNMCLRGGEPPLALPCTPAGCIELLKRSGVETSGKEAVVLGRSNIVGMPVAQLLTHANCTVTVCHSRTQDIPGKVKRADIVVAAIGKAEFVRIKPLAFVCYSAANQLVFLSNRSGAAG
jgi:5,10-methylene-tetrahydrofolate dehydrogenase/methenyl tetrahydrofolate cyclohydrolase